MYIYVYIYDHIYMCIQTYIYMCIYLLPFSFAARVPLGATLVAAPPRAPPFGAVPTTPLAPSAPLGAALTAMPPLFAHPVVSAATAGSGGFGAVGIA